MAIDDRVEYERPLFITEDRVILFRADGTPLRGAVGFMQTTGTFPQLSGNHGYGKGKGSAKTPKKKSGGKY